MTWCGLQRLDHHQTCWWAPVVFEDCIIKVLCARPCSLAKCSPSDHVEGIGQLQQPGGSPGRPTAFLSGRRTTAAGDAALAAPAAGDDTVAAAAAAATTTIVPATSILLLTGFAGIAVIVAALHGPGLGELGGKP